MRYIRLSAEVRGSLRHVARGAKPCYIIYLICRFFSLLGNPSFQAEHSMSHVTGGSYMFQGYSWPYPQESSLSFSTGSGGITVKCSITSNGSL